MRFEWRHDVIRETRALWSALKEWNRKRAMRSRIRQKASQRQKRKAHGLSRQ